MGIFTNTVYWLNFLAGLYHFFQHHQKIRSETGVSNKIGLLALHTPASHAILALIISGGVQRPGVICRYSRRS